MGLHRVQRATRRRGDLVQGHLAEEAEGDDLAIWLAQGRHRQPDGALPLTGQRDCEGIRGWRAEHKVRLELGRLAPLAEPPSGPAPR